MPLILSPCGECVCGKTGNTCDAPAAPDRSSCSSSWNNCAACSRYRPMRSEEHTSELQSHSDLVCRLLLEKKKGGTVEAGAGYDSDEVGDRTKDLREVPTD